MNARHLFAAAVLAGVLGLASVQAANAQGPIPYPDRGTPNPETYSFTAASSGDLIAYFAGSTASFDNQLGVLVNGVAQGGFGLDNHSSSIGQPYNFGHVNAGDSLIFVLHNLTLGEDAFSDPSLNVSYDNPGETLGHNHVYSTFYTGTSSQQTFFPGVPAGTYVAFEDLPFPGSDFNYFDENFVFSNVLTNAPPPSSVPEPGAYALLASLGLTGAALLRRRRVGSRP
ncbi:MAG TPA: PEP-CTERM sorting domain-containing protein [Chthonomonadaceae bacterium]|nr:PEP-CTERM sorting domain-containing protein [Chthonomonadaceae bacterium]